MRKGSIFAMRDDKKHTGDYKKNIQTYSEPSFYSLCCYLAISAGSDIFFNLHNCDN